MNVKDDADKTAMSTKVTFSSSGKGKITAALTREDGSRIEGEKEVEAWEKFTVVVEDESVRETPQIQADDATAEPGKAKWLVKHVMRPLLRVGYKVVSSEEGWNLFGAGNPCGGG